MGMDKIRIVNSAPFVFWKQQPVYGFVGAGGAGKERQTKENTKEDEKE